MDECESRWTEGVDGWVRLRFQLTECGGDGVAVRMDVLDGEDGEEEAEVVFVGPVDGFLAFGHGGGGGGEVWSRCDEG